MTEIELTIGSKAIGKVWEKNQLSTKRMSFCTHKLKPWIVTFKRQEKNPSFITIYCLMICLSKEIVV